MRARLAAACAAACVFALLPAGAGAHPMEAGEVYTPWTSFVGQERAQELTRGGVTARAAQQAAGTSNLTLVGNADKDGTTNSDLAFNKEYVYAGNYAGFRILQMRGDTPLTLADVACNGPQNDVSFWKFGDKTFLFQSIDTPQTAENCSSANAPIVNGARVGYEGVRVFDVTNPSAPVFVDMIQTACGSHTHTLIPGPRSGKGRGQGRGANDKAYIYVSSYPLGSNITPAGAQGPGDYRRCEVPHGKISIIEISAPRGQFQYRLREEQLAADTVPYQGGLGGDKFVSCHDVQVLESRDIALGSCAGESQLWDISDPWTPNIAAEGNHTHVRRSSVPNPAPREFEFMHSGVFTWDGKYFATMDEVGGGGEARCFGPASTDGFYYFYPVVEPGSPQPQLLSKYTIPRNQGSEICVSHNATVVPVRGRYLMSAAYYQGGVTMVDFTNVRQPTEVGYADLVDSTGASDEWSSYWYNGRVFSNSGLNRRGANGNRGLDVFRPTGALTRVAWAAKRWQWSNPQTQEAWQAP